MPTPDETASRLYEGTHPENSAARYPAGPSKAGSSGGSSAPGVAEEARLQGEPDQRAGVDAAASLPERAAVAAAMHRTARRRRREKVQRNDRITVRFSATEHAQIRARATTLNIAKAHLLGDATMAVIEATIPLAGQRDSTDDLIDELAALRTEISRVGTNVNQIARRLNAGGTTQPADTAVIVAAQQAIALAHAALSIVDTTADQVATERGRR